MRHALDLTGQRFGRLTVAERAPNTHPEWGPLWECKCDCGNETNVQASHLRNGNTQSCGCFKKERTVYGMRTRSYGRRRVAVCGAKLMKKLLLASLLCSTAAYAEGPYSNEPVAGYGRGLETCQVALSHDWAKDGELAWIGGFMSAAAYVSPKRDVMPGIKDNFPIFTLVLRYCESHPFETFGNATAETAASLISAQQVAVKGATKF